MGEMDGIEHTAAGMSRKLLLGGLLGATVIAGDAARAADAGGALSAEHHGPNNALPPAAISANRSMFPGFRQTFVRTRGVMVDGKLAEGAVINTLIGGKGPPLLLIHGHPETLICWHSVAGKLAERSTVVLTDLRGYGDSSKPDGGEEHINYAKRTMGADRDGQSSSRSFSRDRPEDDSAAARDLGRERHGRAGIRCDRALEAGGCDGIGTSTSVRTPVPGGRSRRLPCLARRVSNQLIRRP
jgi:hypothetical protein